LKSRVSVIIPCHNTEAFLAETIESVLAQTRPAAEILVIDDGSTDRTREVAASFGARVTLRSKPNGGPASARNLGMHLATGEYLAFLDSDDLWYPEKLARQLAAMETNPQIDLLFSEAWMFREERGARQLLRKIGYTGDPTFRQLLFGDFIPNSTVLLRRSVVDRVGWLNEDRELIGVEDYEYWMRVAYHGTLAGLAEPLAFYRLREGSLMGDGREIEKGLTLALAALSTVESQFPAMWEEAQVQREALLARLHVRAGFAWKQRRAWVSCLSHYGQALRHWPHPRVLRWLVAASILPKWS
jgi:glycosyltransferase involved in cell wall biosynthesis